MAKKRKKPTKKASPAYHATFYTLVALALFGSSFGMDYPENMYFLIGAILVGACAGYWIVKAWKKATK